MKIALTLLTMLFALMGTTAAAGNFNPVSYYLQNLIAPKISYYQLMKKLPIPLERQKEILAYLDKNKLREQTISTPTVLADGDMFVPEDSVHFQITPKGEMKMSGVTFKITDDMTFAQILTKVQGLAAKQKRSAVLDAILPSAEALDFSNGVSGFFASMGGAAAPNVAKTGTAETPQCGGWYYSPDQFETSPAGADPAKCDPKAVAEFLATSGHLKSLQCDGDQVKKIDFRVRDQSFDLSAEFQYVDNNGQKVLAAINDKVSGEDSCQRRYNLRGEVAQTTPKGGATGNGCNYDPSFVPHRACCKIGKACTDALAKKIAEIQPIPLPGDDKSGQ